MSSTRRDSNEPTDFEDEDTCTFTVDPEVLAQERHAGERSSVRERSAVEASAPSTKPPVETVDVERVRALYNRFLDVVGPAAKLLFQETLRELGFTPSGMSAADLARLESRLADCIPVAAPQTRFLTPTPRT